MKNLWDWLVKLFASWRKPTAKPDPQEPDEFARATLHTCPQEVSQWPVVSDLIVTKRGGKLVFESNARDKWPDIDGCCANIHCLLMVDGVWHAGPCDGLRSNWTAKDSGCLCVPDGDSRLFTPAPGERVGVALTGYCRYGTTMQPRQRSGIAWIERW